MINRGQYCDICSNLNETNDLDNNLNSRFSQQYFILDFFHSFCLVTFHLLKSTFGFFDFG